MCGRFTRLYTWKQLHALLDLRYPADIEMQPSWNIAPTQSTPVCRAIDDGERELVPMKWGFTPAWSKGTAMGPINARSETVATSRMFHEAYRDRRCIVPISGFYEWKKAGAATQPYYIRLRTGEPMLMAGIWIRSREGAAASDTFAILTTEPNSLIATIHDRMPLIVQPEAVAEWLAAGPAPETPSGAFPSDEMEMYPVSRRVNSAKHDDSTLCAPVGRDHGLFDVDA